MREIVLTILQGRNYRAITEKATCIEISVFMAWVLNLSHRAKAEFGDDWLTQLQEVCSTTKGQEAKWLRVWLMGLAQKTAKNLNLAVKGYGAYLARVKQESDSAIDQLVSSTSLELHSAGLTPVPLSAGDSVWLLQIAGASVLTLRGSSKSTVGKILEKAIARAFLRALGLQEKKDFELSLAADLEGDRETDAEINTRRGKSRMDVALIGTGNQEVSEDKLQRVGRNGIVLVDKLGDKSKVPANAAKNGVRVILIQKHLPLTDLYHHLSPLMPEDVSLREPPTDEAGLRSLLEELPDNTFAVPQAEIS